MGKPKIVPSFSTPDKNAKWKIKLKKELSKRLGILRWITTYSKMDAISDLIAGITLGLTIVPQSIAYASLARLPAETGLYSAFAGGFLYVIFGTIKQVSIGPTSLMALVTLQYISSVPNQYMLQYLHLFTFLCGMVELLMGILRLGFLTEVISTPVISGFTTASAIIIIVSQIKPILGVSFKSESFNEDIIKLIKNIRNCRKGDALLGLSCIIFLLSLRQMRNYQSKNKLLKKLCWFTSIARNAITVLICGVIAYGIKYYGFRDDIFKLTSEVHSGLPSLKPPSFGINDGNTTITFIEMFQQLKTGVIVIPIVAVLINVSIAKTFATGGTVDATQEMLSLAFCNIFASFLSSMPICGAFTRSAVSNASGVRTPFANFYAAMITILALKFITPSFHYIPKATLAGVLISAVIFLIDVDIFKRLWITCKRDFSILSTTIFLCLYFGVEVGLLIGVVINLFFLLYVWARPRINTEKRKNEYGEIVVVTPELGLFFLGSEHLYTYLSKLADNNTNNVTVAVNCCYFKGIDYSAMKTLSMISQDFKLKNQKLIFFNTQEFVLKLWRNSALEGIRMYGTSQNLDEILFNETINFRRSIPISITDTELSDTKQVLGNGDSNQEDNLLMSEDQKKLHADDSLK